MIDVLIIGGGLAGLVSGIHLSRAGLKVTVLEKNSFPKHKVCGEYISNEVIPYLNTLDIDPFELGATSIKKFVLSSENGNTVSSSLPLGGFGISRYTLDDALFQKAQSHGCRVHQSNVEEVQFVNSHFNVVTRDGNKYTARYVIGAYGKRSSLDIGLNRLFIKEKAPFLAVKCHYKGDFPEDQVALHNFQGGYCGVSKVEEGKINVCYLVNYESFKRYKNIQTFQEEVLYTNPNLKEIFSKITPLWSKPLTISQTSFLPKSVVEQHILMCGDSAGMIHPLCGNGMGMAIHGAQILSKLLIKQGNSLSRQQLEQIYVKTWHNTFQKRLRAGRLLNQVIGNQKLLGAGLYGLKWFPQLLPYIIKQTHGEATPKVELA